MAHDVPAAGRALVVFGDSFTHGEGDPSGLGWVGRVAVAARERLPEPTTVYGQGVCGDTAADVRGRWRGELEARARRRTITHALVAVGTNDLVERFAPEAGGQPPDDELEAGLAEDARAVGEVLDGLAATGAAVGLLGVPPLPPLDPDGAHVCDLERRWRAVSEQRGARFFALREALTVDGRWARALREAPDGAHPAAEGYAAWAEVLIADGLLDWLRCPPARLDC